MALRTILIGSILNALGAAISCKRCGNHRRQPSKAETLAPLDNYCPAPLFHFCVTRRLDLSFRSLVRLTRLFPGLLVHTEIENRVVLYLRFADHGFASNRPVVARKRLRVTRPATPHDPHQQSAVSVLA